MKPEFPDDMVALKRYYGYFWSTKEKKLFSIKSGVLKELKLQYIPRSIYHQFAGMYCYRISHQGKQKTIPLDYIQEKLEPNYTVPVQLRMLEDGKVQFIERK